MNISLILIIVASVGFVIAFASIWFVRKKKKAPKVQPQKETAKEEPAKTDEKKDRNFKIVRKTKGARVSRKALDTNARTAQVERVFEKTEIEQPEPPATQEQLSDDNEELIEAIGSLDKTETSVVSIGELTKTFDRESNRLTDVEHSKLKDDDDQITEEFDGEAFLSSIRRETKSQLQKKDEKDFSDLVEMDAIFNPKFKNKK